MALQDILQAIIDAADQKIEQARTAQQKRLRDMREASERDLAKKRQEIAQQKEEKKAQLRSKTETHVAMQRQHAVLNAKQEMLDEAYAKTAEALGKLSDDQVEPLLRACLKKIKAKGTIHPSEKHAALLKKLAPSEQFTMGDSIKAKGGFTFVSEKIEENCTFEYLVEHVLKPKTVLDATKSLFS